MSSPSHWARALGAAASIIVPLLAMDAAGDGSFTTSEDLESRSKFLAGMGMVTGAMQAPIVVEETIANVKALKHLRRAGAGAAESVGKALLHAGPGYASYVVPVALPFIAAAHLKLKAMRGRRKRRE